MTTAIEDKTTVRSRLSSKAVWDELNKASFAVLSYVTPAGEPRASGVVYKAIGRRLYVATDPDSWKARHIAHSGRVAMTVPVRRGGLLSLVAPIPPATISFHGSANVHPADAPEVRPLLDELKALLPDERRQHAVVIEVTPEDTFLTYGIGVALNQMRDPAAAGARVAVGQGARS
ncbi:MAG TPA: pyridoxamine 5'-phosphate oxidase family protein [Euzebyales bacterium]|nr:pyridoxamine 5'-phosphate oxidase family protein [Euzebyales bacterium]